MTPPRRQNSESPSSRDDVAHSVGSVTLWMLQLVDGDKIAAARLWERYHQRLLKLDRAKLRGRPQRVADEEDAAIEAFDSFCRRAKQGGFPQLGDREDLWHLLVAITIREVVDQVNRERRQKRGGGRVIGESDLPGIGGAGDAVRWSDAFVGEEPSPELAAQFEDEYERLMRLLPDDQARQIARMKLEGHTEVEIGKALGRVPRTVRRRVEVIRRLWGDELGMA